MTKVTAEKILLGYGTVSVGGVPVGLTRGGSSFVVEREVRQIEADGDKGPVKGRIVIDSEIAKLTVNALELFNAADMSKYYPALDLETTATYDKVTGTLAIADGDYNDVVWTGATKDGKAVQITVENAVNMGNLEWGLEDKSEAVPSIEFTAAYLETARSTPPWDVQLAKGDAYSVTLTITSDGSTAVEDASVTLYGQTVESDASGEAAFANVPEGTNYAFSVVKGGYQTYFGAIDVAGITADTITLTAI